LHGCEARAVPLGVDGYQSSGRASELLTRAALDRVGIMQRMRELLAR